MKKKLLLLSMCLLATNVSAKTVEEIYSEIAPGGVITIDSVPIKKINENSYSDKYAEFEGAMYESVSNVFLKNKYGMDNVYLYCDNNETNCYLQIKDKSQPVKVEYNSYNEKVYSKVQEFSKNFKSQDLPVEERLFIIDDMENVNFFLATDPLGNENIDLLNVAINYSKDFQKLIAGTNLQADVVIRAGWDDVFTHGCFGQLLLSYENFIYSGFHEEGVNRLSVIYVPDDTEDTTEKYIEAAIKRIKDYNPNIEVTIKYKDQISSLDDTDWIIKLQDIVDVNKTLNEYYTLTINGYEHLYFIAKDSSKIKEKPTLNTEDITSGVKIETEDPTVPLDAKVSYKEIDKESTIFKDIMSTLKLKTGYAFDLNIFSEITKSFVKKIDNGLFKVYIPISDEYQDKKLYAYYINDDKKIDTYEVKIENGYAVFETNHFSTYTLGEALPTNNTEAVPKTLDKLSKYLMVLALGTLGMISSLLIYKKQK